MLLRRVFLERRDLALEVLLLQGDVPLVADVEVVPRDLVAEDGRSLDRAPPFLRDRPMVLMDVVQARLEDDVRLPLLPHRDEELEDVLPVLRERSHVEVVHSQTLLGDAELRRRLAHLARERVRRKALRQRARRDRERDVSHLAAGVDKPRHRAAAAELAVVGVRREDDRALPLLDQTGTASRASTGGAGGAGLALRGAASAISPTRPQVVGSSKKAS